MLNNNVLLCTAGGGGNDFLSGPIKTAPSGRKYARHKSRMGSVMFYNDGSEKYVIVLDAQFRFSGVDMAATKWASNITLPKIRTPAAYYLNPLDRNTPASNKLVCRTIDDNWLNMNMFFDPNSARYNGNTWRALGSPAVLRTRSILINGAGCDVPTINQALRIMCDAPTINRLDPTASSFPGMALEEEDYYWSSTVSDMPGTASGGYSILDCHSSSRAHYNGYGLLASANSSTKNMKYVPVLEIAV